MSSCARRASRMREGQTKEDLPVTIKLLREMSDED